MRPSLIRQMSALVPPISMVMMSSIPQAAATSRAPTTPAAGPDSAVSAGARRMRARAGDAAVRLHEQERRRDPSLVEALLQPRDVGRHRPA